MNKKDIAIIGIAGRFSNSDDIKMFWENLRKGEELMHFYSPEELVNMGVDKQLILDENYIKVKSIIKEKNCFDAAFFGYTKEEASLMDPQIRFFHEYTWKAMEDAGYNPIDCSEKVGLFAAASENLNWLAYTMMERSKSDIDPFYANMLANKNFMSSLVAYKLNLKGPCYFVDTACSSSLSAVHLACRSLLMRECTMAVAGAVSIRTNVSVGYQYQEGMINSRDGHCRTFDSDSSGTIGGEGIGVVVFKRMEDAVRDNDQIYAVIRSSAVNNDGNRKVGYTAPSITGQAECIVAAHQFAGVSPDSISYVEAHGTATKLGDPIEIEALNYAFGKNRNKHCAIGSVKSNLGHLDAAAGLAGLIKTTLALKNKEIPASLNFQSPNPEINFEDGPFFVNTDLKKWERTNNTPLRAGVSSFGIGGSNAHLVLEENTELCVTTSSRKYSLMLFSARSKSSLNAHLNEFKNFISTTDLDHADIAFTLKKRKPYMNRHFVLHGPETNQTELWRNGKGHELLGTSSPQITFMFSGQGSQYVNMGKDLYENEPYFKELVDIGLTTVEKLTGRSYSEVWFGILNQSDDKINDTLYAQPLLYIFEYALAQLLMKWGIVPDFMIGHSIGELSAACTAGVFSFSDGLKLVVKRAELMSALPNGCMLGVATDESVILPLLNKSVSIAAINSPQLLVVSGSEEDISALSLILDEKKIVFTRLKTSHAFHSEMMRPIVEEFKEIVSTIQLQRPRIPILSNINAESLGEKLISADYWANHIVETVNFYSGITKLIQKSDMIFLEIGPGNSLSTFCNQIKKYLKTNNVVLNTISHPLDRQDDQLLLIERLGLLWLHGVSINWKAFYEDEIRRHVSIPTYCFDRYEYPTEVDAFNLISSQIKSSNDFAKENDVSEWMYLPGWKNIYLTEMENSDDDHHSFLVLSDESAISRGLIDSLVERGKKVVVVVNGENFKVIDENHIQINQQDEKSSNLLYAWLSEVDFDFDCLVDMWCFEMLDEDHNAISSFINNHFTFLLNLYKSILQSTSKRKRKLFFLTNELQSVLGTERQNNISASIILAYMKILAQEAPEFFTCCIDMLKSDLQPLSAICAQLFSEIINNDKNATVALRNGSRWCPDFQKINQAKKATILRQDGTYLITGGLGSLGLTIAEYLITHYNATLILLGRSKLVQDFDSKGSNNSVLDKSNVYNQLKSLSDKVSYYEVDVSDYESLVCLKRELEGAGLKFDGIIHTAGNVNNKNFKPLEFLTLADIKSHFDPKIYGLNNLFDIFNVDSPDFFWLSSSISSVLGGLTFGAYTAGNMYMDYYAQTHANQTKKIISIGLDGLSLAEDSDLVINKSELPLVFELSLQFGNTSQIIVSTCNITERIKKTEENKLLETTSENIALISQFDRPSLASVYIEPETETEVRLLSLWKEFFGFEKIGVLDNFFELGGDSLKAMRLVKKIHKEFNVEISIELFFKTPYIKSFAVEIDIYLNIHKIKTLEGKAPRKEIVI